MNQTLKLLRMRTLMEKLGNPQKDLTIIHVAGTNGKGSVCAMLSSILQEAGFQVGLFTSPHLIDVNERIQVQNIPVANEDYKQIEKQVKEKAKEIQKEGHDEPGFFEYMTAIAFVYFSKVQTDLVILETGIGGNYDATNIIENPLISVITSIAKDHVSMLGDTIEEIAREKGGIIKRSRPLVLYEGDKSVYNTISKLCKAKESKLIAIPETKVTNEVYNLDGMTFDIKNKDLNYKEIHLQLIGKYQINNTITTLTVINELINMDYIITKDKIYKGLYKTKWSGRMEVVSKNPTIILDGAHNLQSAKAFVESVKSINKDKKVTILMGIFKDKQYKEIISTILPIAKSLVVTQSYNPRALPAGELYQAIKDHNPKIKIKLEKDLEKAYKESENLKKGEFFYCIGSLYLVGEIKEILKNQEARDDKF